MSVETLAVSPPAPVPVAAMLLQHLADAVYLLDPQTSNVVWGNQAAWQSLGLSSEQVLNHSVLSLQMDVTGAPQWSEIAEVIRSVPCFTFVGRHRHAAGHEVPVEVNTTRFFEGEREYFLSVARDISRRLALEADLKKRENQLWFALNEAMDGLWDWNVLTGEVFFSPQLKRMLGYGPDEMSPTLSTWSANIHPDDAARVQGLLSAHLQGRRVRYEAEYRLRNRNGNFLWVIDRGRVCERDDQGQPTRVVGMVQDVTQERETRAALQRSEEEQRTLIAALPDVIMRFDRQGRHLYVSENVKLLSVMPAAAMVGRTHHELGFPAHLCQRWSDAIESVFQTGQPHESEFELSAPGGERTISWRLVPDVDPATGVRSVLAVCRDITDRRLAEAELARHRHHLEELVEERTAALSDAKAVAEEANRAKSRFLANMSHELRTPLTAIIGMTGLARGRVQQAAPGGVTDAVVDGQLGRVEQASHHLLNLINDVLDLSKIEANQMALEVSAFRLEGVLDNLMVLASHRAKEKGLQLVLSLPRSLSTKTLQGDPLRLKQVLLNLVDNAIKFTEAGQVELRVQPLAAPGQPGETRGELGLRFEVVDSGIGIRPEARERLFLPFEQADNTTTRRYGGTGLGLAISEHLVRLMGGQIGLDSAPGEGSCFWFTLRLPMVAPEAEPAQPDTASARLAEARAALAARHGGQALLIADDDPVGREIGVQWLRQAGFVVTAATDGVQAVALASKQAFALILMDMQMPGLNGLDATRQIRAGGRNSATPVVALTANAFEEDRQRCLAAGMNAFLVKPVDPEAMYQTLSHWLAQPAGGAGA